MAWLFPAETLLQDPDFVSRASPVTIVSDAIDSLVTAPIPHHYGLIDLANCLDPESRTRPDGTRWWFHVNKFYRDPLSDQIPSERGHEIWNRTSPFQDQDFQWHQEQVREVVRRKLRATQYVTDKVTRLLQDDLTSRAPRVSDVFQRVRRLTGVGDDGQILFQHTRLMAAARRLEVDLLMAMPPHEREARYHSARVSALLEGSERYEGLESLELGDRAASQSILLLRLSERSREARLKEGEFVWSLLPESRLPELQDLNVAQFKQRNPTLEATIPVKPWEWQTKLRDALTVTILRVDRERRLLAVEAGRLLAATIRLGLLQMDFDGPRGRFGILDPVAMDVFTRKLKRSLENPSGIRNPPLAQCRPLFPTQQIARVRAGRPRVGGQDGSAAQLIWSADELAKTDSRLRAGPLLAIARRLMPDLTQRQRSAISQAVTRRLALWWGPPGTGKSRTAQAYLSALALQAAKQERPLRVAISGLTWVAIDNVARRLPQLLALAGLANDVHIYRLASSATVRGVDPALVGHLTSMGDDSNPRRLELERRLATADGVTLVASTVDQLYKLAGHGQCAPLFDVLLIDEASQLDVAHALVAFSKLDKDARVVIVGDDKQMSPIHPLDAPDGLEHLVGSIYDFFRQYRLHEGPQFAIEPVMLNRSFRSNREIVSFVREAGYGQDLEAAQGNAGLRIRTAQDVAAARPSDWPERLPFSPHFARIVAPEDPLVAVVHNDRYSSQRNDGEADLAAGLVLALFRAGLYDLDAEGEHPYSPNDFFRRAVGIVTPHRAQQAAVYDRLARVLPNDVDRNAVFDSIDTVERFQGQERAVMIASFGLGDTDQIAAEERFMFSLNRFNVTASRAQAKFIALISRRLVDYLPRDRRALEESRLLKHFVDGFLTRSEELDLPAFGRCDLKLR